MILLLGGKTKMLRSLLGPNPKSNALDSAVRSTKKTTKSSGLEDCVYYTSRAVNITFRSRHRRLGHRGRSPSFAKRKIFTIPSLYYIIFSISIIEN